MTLASTVSVGPTDASNLDSVVMSMKDGDTLLLAPGVYSANLRLERSITIRGATSPGGDPAECVVLDGGQRGPCIQVANAGCTVAIEGVTLRNGRGKGGEGGCLSIYAAKEVLLRQVDFLGGHAEAGGALFVRSGECQAEHCRFLKNYGELAQAVWVYQDAKVTLRHCLIIHNVGPAPAVTASWAGQLQLHHCTILTSGTAALRAVGTGAQAPQISALHCLLSEPSLEVLRGGLPQPTIRLRDTVWSATFPIPGVIDEGGNLVADWELKQNNLLNNGPGTAGQEAVL